MQFSEFCKSVVTRTAPNFFTDLETHYSKVELLKKGEISIDDPWLDEYRQWLLIWSAGLCSEWSEVFEAFTGDKKLIFSELGDICWYYAAVAMMLGVDLSLMDTIQKTSQFNVTIETFDNKPLIQSLFLLDYVKKFARDKRTTLEVIAQNNLIVSWVTFCSLYEYDPEVCFTLVNQKLMERYPNGFNPNDSINRHQEPTLIELSKEYLALSLIENPEPSDQVRFNEILNLCCHNSPLAEMIDFIDLMIAEQPTLGVAERQSIVSEKVQNFT